MLIAIPCLAGIVGAKLYHVLESPADFFAHPVDQLISPYGFAWFGGLLAGFAAFVLVGRRQKIPLLTLLDAGSPAAALGYGIGRIGCFLSGDGDYGIPTSLPWGMSFPNGLVPTTQRVHPTPIYELIVACAIAWWLWKIGARQAASHSTSPQLQKCKFHGKPTAPEFCREGTSRIVESFKASARRQCICKLSDPDWAWRVSWWNLSASTRARF